FFRLYPAYWVCLSITFIATLIFSSVSAPLSLKEFLVNLTMFQNWFKVKDVDGAYWSLVPELRFYLLVAIIIVLGLKDKLFITLLIWTLLSIINQVHIIYYLSAFLELNYSFFFISGIIFYKKWSGEIDKKTVALLFLNIGMALYVHSKSVGGTIVIAIAFSLFYFLLYKPGIIKGWLLKILKFLGDISFPLYLIHQVVGFIIITKLRMFFPSINSIVFVFTTIGFCIFFAYIITVFIEKPGIRFGKLLTSKLSYAEKTE
ncbi:MAG: acyltransferase family protein, partial [Bacteroidia bacterium]